MTEKNSGSDKILIIFLLIMYFLFGKLLSYCASKDFFIAFARQINFSIRHLSNYISIIFYIIQLLIYWFLFRDKIIEPKLFCVNNVSKQSKHIIIILIICFAVFAFLVTSHSIPIGTKFNNSFFGAVVSFILVVLIAPFSEELFFRVILIGHIRKYYDSSVKRIIILQSVLFYIPHLMNGNYTLYTFYVGVITGIFYCYTGSIVYCVILHSLSNFASYLITLNIINYRLPITIPIWIAFFIISFVFFYHMLHKLIKTTAPFESIVKNTN